MAEHDSPARRRDSPQDLYDSERADRELLRREERQLARQSVQLTRFGRALRFADLMAVMMVLATVLSAYATWKTAQVTSMVFAVADRPFLGVSNVAFEAIQSRRPMITVDFRNFGQIPAVDAIVSVHAVVDGKRVKPPDGEMSSIEAGNVSPTVPHYFYAYLTPEAYKSVASGDSNLQVHVSLIYKGPQLDKEYCYFERIVYDYRSATFRMAGGNDHCGSEVF
jgi:hypothetical protein